MEKSKKQKAIDAATKMEEKLCEIDAQIECFEETSYDTVANSVDNLEAAKLDVTLAYGLASLYYILLNSKGKNSTDHPVKEELGRIKKYVDRIKAIENPQSNKRKLVVDQAAAARMIQHELLQNNS